MSNCADRRSQGNSSTDTSLKTCKPWKIIRLKQGKLLQMAFRSNLIRSYWKVSKLVLKVPLNLRKLLKGFSQESISNFGPQTGIYGRELYN